ncbi:MAG: hypothetical protein HY326_00460 [Chloroflexi bacterium]|nr:hypothetical protein [Chloroflexota bacterium]
MSKQPVFARGQASSVEITEKYCYIQKISHNLSILKDGEPAGSLEIQVPYDGHQAFTRVSLADVEPHLKKLPPQEELSAHIGFLALSNIGAARLDKVKGLDLSNGFNTVPIIVPVRCQELDSTAELHADRHACIVTYDYMPRWPDIPPVATRLSLQDQDELEVPQALPGAEIPTAEWEKVATQITQRKERSNQLKLIIHVILNLPRSFPKEGWKVGSIHASLTEPQIYSLTGEAFSENESKSRMRHNPATQKMEVLKPTVSEETVRTDARTFSSKPIYLHFSHPGELFEVNLIKGEVTVSIKGKLLSGLQVRLFEGSGRTATNVEPELVTNISTKFELSLDQIFTRRKRSLSQYFLFQDLKPERVNIRDIIAILAGHDYRLLREIPLQNEPEKTRYLLHWQKPQGPEKLDLWLVTEIEQISVPMRVFSQGRQYNEVEQLSEVKIYMQGELPVYAGGLAREMNAIQRLLREHFNQLQRK